MSFFSPPAGFPPAGFPPGQMPPGMPPFPPGGLPPGISPPPFFPPGAAPSIPGFPTAPPPNFVPASSSTLKPPDSASPGQPPKRPPIPNEKLTQTNPDLKKGQVLKYTDANYSPVSFATVTLPLPLSHCVHRRKTVLIMPSTITHRLLTNHRHCGPPMQSLMIQDRTPISMTSTVQRKLGVRNGPVRKISYDRSELICILLP